MQKKKKMLAVDDNTDNNAIVEELFGDHCDLRTATTGEKALEIVQTFRPDVVLLDIMMPGMDGYEVCRRLREQPAFEDIKILMVTAKGALEDRVKGYEVGANDFITKPFEEENILESVEFFV
ncbi:MAG: response regulator [Sedimentisphaerales bacterium]|nr:response regulator [Sedimentisphaerales bacterium]